MKMNTTPVRQVEVTRVIRVTSVRGAGTETDPCREIEQYWTMEGELLSEDDPLLKQEYVAERRQDYSSEGGNRVRFD